MSQYNVDSEVRKEFSTRGIGRYEVKVVVLTMHKGKATGMDAVPVEGRIF